MVVPVSSSTLGRGKGSNNMKNPNPPRTTNVLALAQNHGSPVCEGANLPYAEVRVKPPIWGVPLTAVQDDQS